MPDVPALLKWIRERQSKPEVYGTTFLSIRPADNTLVGITELTFYMRCSRHLLLKPIDDWSLPCMSRPDGQWTSTMSAIDQWIFMASMAESENRKERLEKDASNKLRKEGREFIVGGACDHGSAQHHVESDPSETAAGVRSANCDAAVSQERTWDEPTYHHLDKDGI